MSNKIRFTQEQLDAMERDEWLTEIREAEAEEEKRKEQIRQYQQWEFIRNRIEEENQKKTHPGQRIGPEVDPYDFL